MKKIKHPTAAVVKEIPDSDEKAWLEQGWLPVPTPQTAPQAQKKEG